MKYFLILTISISIHVFCRAQVINDNIENRLLLPLEEVLTSKTDNCTVQWECVDEKLTGKCIEYHNDQWFYFNSGTNRKLYLNISGQQCRDLYGVQVVIIKGEPCQVSDYKILDCISLATQDDIHVVLDSLELNQEYLINIDGYLEDYCRFQLQISKNPMGMPLKHSRF